jgi:hypothetical protein
LSVAVATFLLLVVVAAVAGVEGVKAACCFFALLEAVELEVTELAHDELFLRGSTTMPAFLLLLSKKLETCAVTWVEA